MTSPRLLVASIYAPSQQNRQWRSLQEKFVRECSAGSDLDFRYYLNGVRPEDLGDGEIRLLGRSADNKGHSAALRAVISIFRRVEYDYYLILDSDCFPVFPGWLPVLIKQMSRYGKRFAAPVRTENLDRFPHPCAFLIAGAAVHDDRLNFDIGRPQPNLLNVPVADVGTAMTPLMPEVLPLLRTNYRNRHPVAAGIYHHMFYHHGAGSRAFRFRLTHDCAYTAHWWDNTKDGIRAEILARELVQDPGKYLAGLMEA